MVRYVCLCRISSNDAADTAANVRRRSIDKPPLYATCTCVCIPCHVRRIRRSDFDAGAKSFFISFFLSFARSISREGGKMIKEKKARRWEGKRRRFNGFPERGCHVRAHITIHDISSKMKYYLGVAISLE